MNLCCLDLTWPMRDGVLCAAVMRECVNRAIMRDFRKALSLLPYRI